MSISIILPILVTVAGLFLLVKLRFFFVLHPKKTLNLFKSSLKEKDNRNSLCLALAGTLGVGNIFGIAAGIMIGGAGSVFWLLVSSFFSAVIKYSETLLATDSLTEKDGGMHLVIRKSLKKAGRLLSYIYAALCLFLALLMGAAIQSKAAYDVSREAFGISPVAFSLLFFVLIALSVFKGGEKIEKIMSILIPFTTIIYIFLAFFVISRNFSSLDDVIISVFRSAFSSSAGLGGLLGFLLSRGLKEGFARGILSNEAGVGTSAMAHSRAKKRAPATAGLYGMCEVFFDTVVLCPLTALMILVSGTSIEDFSSPMSLVSYSVESTLGKPALFLLTFCILSFAYSTVTCWFYYGTECSSYLFKNGIRYVFPPLFFAFVFFGTVSEDGILLSATDIIILLMSALTLSVILKENNRIKSITKSSGLI